MIKKYYGNELYHHGIKGQKWGIRRYQNEDGTYTAEGRERYGIDENGKMSRAGAKQYKHDTKLDKKYQQISTKQKAMNEIYKGKAKNNYNTAENKMQNENYEWQKSKILAKMDSSYKDTKQFAKAQQAAKKNVEDDVMYGAFGSKLARSFEEGGDSGAKARVKAGAIIVGGSILMSVAVGALTKAANG